MWVDFDEAQFLVENSCCIYSLDLILHTSEVFNLKSFVPIQEIFIWRMKKLRPDIFLRNLMIPLMFLRAADAAKSQF